MCDGFFVAVSAGNRTLGWSP